MRENPPERDTILDPGSDASVHAALQVARIGYWVNTPDGGTLEWNQTLHEICGVEEADLATNSRLWETLVVPEDLDRVIEHVEMIASGQQVHDVRFAIRTPAGESRYLKATGGPVIQGGAVVAQVGVIFDITSEVKRPDNPGAEKDGAHSAIRESHHRAKNNLLSLRSLINLSGEETKAIEAIRQKIDAYIAAEDAIVISERRERVDGRAVLLRVIEPNRALISELGTELHTDLSTTYLPSNVAIPLALIANELLTNAIRHGVRPGHGDSITVAAVGSDEAYTVTVANNGNPFDGTRTATRGNSGLGLVSRLARQIDGSVEIERHPHTTISVRVPRRES